MAQFSVKSIILYYVYAIYVWPAIRSRHARDTTQKSALQSAHAEQEQPYLKPTTRKASHRYFYRAKQERKTRDDDAGEWMNTKFGLVPKMSGLGKAVYCSTTITHVYFIVCGVLFRDRILDTSGSNYYYYSCLLPRPILSGLLSQKMTIELFACMGMLHVGWRVAATMTTLKDKLIFDVVEFLLADEEILDKIRIATEFGPEFVDDLDECRIDRTRYEILRDCLYYKLNDADDLSERFALRPNRTIEWHRKFHHYIRLVVGPSSTLYWLVVIALALNAADILFCKQQIVYHGCDVLDFRSIIYWLRAIGSGSVGIIAMIDTFTIVVCTPSIYSLVMFDTWIYWDHLRQQADAARRQMPFIRAVEDSYSCQQWKLYRLFQPAAELATGYPTDQPAADRNRATELIHRGRRRRGRRRRRLAVATSTTSSGLDATCAHIRAGLIDFFHQLHRADGFIRGLTTLSLCFWLLVNTWLILTGFQFAIGLASTNQLIMRFVQTLGFMLLTLVCWPTLEMRRKIESLYVMLCSLMANDSNSRKNKWNKLLLYYMNRPRYSFTIFDSRIFTRLIFGKILSFAVTFIFVFESLRLTELAFTTGQESDAGNHSSVWSR